MSHSLATVISTAAQHKVSVQLDYNYNYKPIITIARRDSYDQLGDGRVL